MFWRRGKHVRQTETENNMRLDTKGYAAGTHLGNLSRPDNFVQ